MQPSTTLYAFFFLSYGHLRDLHSFPTRRSSDLSGIVYSKQAWKDIGRSPQMNAGGDMTLVQLLHKLPGDTIMAHPPDSEVSWFRSEEHTSELQSRENLVCRLLLEKKKKTNKRNN